MPLDQNKAPTSAFGGVKGHLLSAIQDVETEIKRLGDVRKELQSALAHAEDAEAAFTSQAQYMTSKLVRAPEAPAAYPAPPSPPPFPTQPFADAKRTEDEAAKALDAVFPPPVAKAKS